MNCSRPAPDPVGLYATLFPGQYRPHNWLKTAIAFCCAVDPSAVTAFFPPQPADPASPGRSVAEVPVRLSSLPQAVDIPAAVVVANATAPKVLITLPSLTDPAPGHNFWTDMQATAKVCAGPGPLAARAGG